VTADVLVIEWCVVGILFGSCLGIGYSVVTQVMHLNALGGCKVS